MAVILQYLMASASPSTVDPGTRGASITNAGSLPTFRFGPFSYPTDPVLRAGSLSGATSAALAVSNGSFWTIAITPNSGKILNLTSLTFDVARGGRSTPRGYVIRTSADSFAANVQTADVPSVRPNFTAISVDLSGSQYQNLSGQLTVRIYTYSRAGATLEFDNLTLNGTVADAQQPSGNSICAASLSNTPVRSYNGAAVLYSNRIMFPRAGNIASVLKYWIGEPGYGAGAGGSYRYEIQTDDGSSNHWPSGTVIGTTPSVSGNPAIGRTYFPVLTFSSPASVQPSVWYHLVVQNTDGDPNANWISMNDLYSGPIPVRQPQNIPNEQFAVLYINGTGGAWRTQEGMTAIVDFRYDDDTHFGVGYMEVASTVAGSAMGHIASGSNRVRQVFTVSGGTRSFSQIFVRVLRQSGSEPLTVTLDSQSAQTNAARLGGHGTGWSNFADAEFVSVDLPITLTNGSTYALELSAPSGTTYLVPAVRDGLAAGYGFAAETVFADGWAQYDTGSGWIDWDTWGTPSRDQDLSFYFQ